MTAMHLQDSRKRIEQILTLKPKEGGSDINALLASLFGADKPSDGGPLIQPRGCFDDPLLSELAAIQKQKMK